MPFCYAFVFPVVAAFQVAIDQRHTALHTQGTAIQQRHIARAVITVLADDWATPMQMATTKSLRQVATYRKLMDGEVESLRSLLETTSKEVEAVAVSVGRPLADDWAVPMQMATKKALRQVAIYSTSMEAEVEGLRSQLEIKSKEAEEAQAAKEELETAVVGAKLLAEELAKETRKKEMHHAKAREFYAEASAAKSALASVRAELDELRADNGDPP